MGHNGPLLSLAAPLRSRRDVLDEMMNFISEATSPVTDAPAVTEETSVPVQAQTR
jgi:hypothetical protein